MVISKREQNRRRMFIKFPPPTQEELVNTHTCQGAPLYDMRSRAHEAFDTIWMYKMMDRNTAYRWLSIKLGMPFQETHMRIMDYNTCKQVIHVTKEYGEAVRSGQQSSPTNSLSYC
jgi:hypothetical protein